MQGERKLESTAGENCEGLCHIRLAAAGVLNKVSSGASRFEFASNLTLLEDLSGSSS